MVLFGVHAYDIFGLNILDRVFAQGKYVDPYYIARRKSTTIIGVDFEPDDKHFAYSMNADFVDSGFDLFLSDIGEDYLVLVGTSRGDDIVLMSGCLLQEPTEADFAEYKRRSSLGDLPTRPDSSSASCRKSWRWNTTAKYGMRWESVASPAAHAAQSARPATASTSTTISSWWVGPEAGSDHGTPACSRPTPWSPAERTSDRRERPGSNSATTTSSAASSPSMAGRVVLAAAAVSRPARPKSTSSRSLKTIRGERDESSSSVAAAA